VTQRVCFSAPTEMKAVRKIKCGAAPH
jgi:hypothetical protein